MKRLLPLLMALLLLTGCAKTAAPDPEGSVWQLVTAQRSADGAIVACAPGMTGMPEEAVPVDITCRMSGGMLVLAGSGVALTCSWRVTRIEPQSRQLAVTLGDTEGLATLSHTVFADGSAVPTLLITLGGYTLTFHGISVPV